MRSERTLALVEFALWVFAAAVAVVLVVGALGLLIGGDLVAAKVALMVVGFLLFGVASFAIQPSGPDLEGSIYDPDEYEDVDDGSTNGFGITSVLGGGPSADDSGLEVDDRSERERQHPLEARLQEVGPLADRELPYERRIGRSYKLFVTSLLVLAASFLLEVAGVQA